MKLGALLLATASLAGCVSMPTGGPVKSYPVTQEADAQNEQLMQIQPQPPGRGWGPGQVVQGFLTASASFGSYSNVVQQYLAPEEQRAWKTNWSAIVYKNGPSVTAPAYPSTAKNPDKATVAVTGDIQASLKGSGSYSVPSAQGKAPYVPPFQLRKVKGQWRISFAPRELLLTTNSFARDYQLRDLYFFDPANKYLVPDPVYVPVGARTSDLVNGLVHDLSTPPADWLTAGATTTAFPDGTKVSAVALDGVTAIVNLTGTVAKADDSVMERISAQLLSTLSVAARGGPNGQSVQSVEVQVNGKPWVPSGHHGNPVQLSSKYAPADGKSSTFYYVDSAGYLNSRPAAGGAPRRVASIGTKFSKIAVSPDGGYVAALRGKDLYAGIVGHPLVKRGTGYVAISWDVHDNLWASAGDKIVMFRGSGAGQELGGMVPVDLASPFNQLTPQYTQLEVAPDGVRVAIVQAGGGVLSFGAISGAGGPVPQITLSSVQQTPLTQAQNSPAVATFTALSWYGPKDVITLAEPGPAVTDYSVSGGSSATIPNVPDMQTISASYKQPLIAGLTKGRLVTDASLSGAWLPLQGQGAWPTYPG